MSGLDNRLVGSSESYIELGIHEASDKGSELHFESK
jgi:hypothetical protein